MPRRNRNNSLIVLDEHADPNSVVFPVKTFLKNQVWDLLEQQNKECECSICLETIKCKNCYCLLTCGHSFHMCCIIGQTRCPLCRN